MGGAGSQCCDAGNIVLSPGSGPRIAAQRIAAPATRDAVTGSIQRHWSIGRQADLIRALTARPDTRPAARIAAVRVAGAGAGAALLRANRSDDRRGEPWCGFGLRLAHQGSCVIGLRRIRGDARHVGAPAPERCADSTARIATEGLAGADLGSALARSRSSPLPRTFPPLDDTSHRDVDVDVDVDLAGDGVVDVGVPRLGSQHLREHRDNALQQLDASVVPVEPD